jgi:hypothetical protein
LKRALCLPLPPSHARYKNHHPLRPHPISIPRRFSPSPFLHFPSSVRSLQVNLQGSYFDTTLGVFTGSSLDSLALVVSNDDCPFAVDGAGMGNVYSCASFHGEEGQVYSLQVDGYGEERGQVYIDVIEGRDFDSFDGAGQTLPVKATLEDASIEYGEPLPNAEVTATLWFVVLSPSSGPANISVSESALVPGPGL